MRTFVLAAAALATLLPVTAASAAHRPGHYNREVRAEQRECARELRRADSRREYRRAQRDCRREIAEARRDARRDWREDRRDRRNWDRRHWGYRR